MGSPQNPMTHEELENKFIGLATRVVPEEQASKIAATVRNLEEIEELRDLTDLWSAHPTEARRDQTVFARAPQRSFPASARRIVDQGRSSPGSRSLPFFDRSGSVHAERLKQQGRLFPLFIFEMLTSTLRPRVSGFFVALTQRTHSQRAIGVISFHRSWIFCGAAATAAAKSSGTLGSGQSLVTSMSSAAVSPALTPAACCSASSIRIQWPEFPSGSSTVWNSTPLIVPRTATCPREGRLLLAISGNRNTVDVSIVDSVASKRTVALAVR
jgi:hypothetical protein